MKQTTSHRSRRPSDIAAAGAQPSGKEDLTHMLVLRFQQLLSDGLLSPGARLPSERDLALSFGVARSSLRQALKVLEIMGVITQKVGDGSYLNNDASAVLAVPMEFLFLLDGTSLQELIEMRLMMEPALAAKAAERATAEDIALLRQSIVDLKDSEQNRVRLVASDLTFHRAIFQATGNRLSGRLFHTIHRAMLNMMMVTSQLVDLQHTLQFHIPILAAIERRDSEKAYSLMRDHLIDARNLVLQSQEEARAHNLRQHLASSGDASRRQTPESKHTRPGPARKPVAEKKSALANLSSYSDLRSN